MPPERALEVPTGLGALCLLALSQLPDGARLSDIARAIDRPLSSAQSSLGLLVRIGLLDRSRGKPPTYRLTPAGRGKIADTIATARHDDPDRARDVLLRASSSVAMAVRDDAGYVVVRRDDDPRAESLDRIVTLIPIEAALAWSTFGDAEFRRILRIAPDLRARIGAAEMVKPPRASN